MKNKRMKKIMVLVFLLIGIGVFNVRATTSFYYPTEAEINRAIDRVKSEYPSGSVFTGTFLNGSECIGFAKYAFNCIWGVDCLSSYPKTEKYKLSVGTNDVIEEVGSLSGSSLTYQNLKNMFQNTPKGSLVQMCTSSGQHTMLFVSATDSAINVLEANVDYHGKVSHSTISYSYFVNNCVGTYTVNGVTSSTGVSSYRYNGKKNTSEYNKLYDGAYVRIKNAISGKYVTAYGTDVVMRSNDSSYYQIWKVVANKDTNSKDYGSIKLVSLATGKSITMQSQSNANGVDLYLTNDSDLPTQKWYFNRMLVSNNSTYMISPQCARTVIDVTNANDAENATLAMYEDNRTKSQQFEIESVLSMYLNFGNTGLGSSFIGTIRNKENTKYLTNTNTGVVFQENKTSLSQLWKFTKNSDGTYQIKSYLDDKNLSVARNVKRREDDYLFCCYKLEYF